MAKKALGKGLGALIQKQESSTISSTKTTVEEHEVGSFDNSVRLVSVDLVTSSPLQPRKHFTEGMLDDLMESIKQLTEQLLHILQQHKIRILLLGLHLVIPVLDRFEYFACQTMEAQLRF